MTTHGIVGVYENLEKPSLYNWHAVRICADAYPSGAGSALYTNYVLWFDGDMAKLTKRLVDDQPMGWGDIAGKNFMLPAVANPLFSGWFETLASGLLKNAKLDINWHDWFYSQNPLAQSLRQIPDACEAGENDPPPAEWMLKCTGKVDDDGIGYTVEYSADINYFAEWSYLMNPLRHTVDVFHGSPLDEDVRCVTVNFKKDLGLEYWDNFQGMLYSEENEDE